MKRALAFRLGIVLAGAALQASRCPRGWSERAPASPSFRAWCCSPRPELQFHQRDKGKAEPLGFIDKAQLDTWARNVEIEADALAVYDRARAAGYPALDQLSQR